MSWLPAFFVPLIVAYLAGRFIAASWLRWPVTAAVVLAPAVGPLSELLSADDPEAGVYVLFIVVIVLVQFGMAAFVCMVGRSQRLIRLT